MSTTAVNLDDKVTLSVEETAEALGVSYSLAYRRIKAGDIPSRRVGHRIVVPVSRFKKWLAEETPQQQGTA